MLNSKTPILEPDIAAGGGRAQAHWAGRDRPGEPPNTKHKNEKRKRQKKTEKEKEGNEEKKKGKKKKKKKSKQENTKPFTPIPQPEKPEPQTRNQVYLEKAPDGKPIPARKR